MSNSPIPAGSKVVAYLRDSGGSRQTMSVPQQEESVRQWCAERGLTLIEVYRDVAKSAKRGIAGRDEFQRMLADIAKQPPAAVVFWDVRRWAREVFSGMMSLLEVMEHGVKVIPITEEIPEGVVGLMMWLLKISSAEDENKSKVASVRRGMHHMARTYKIMMTGQTPIGYMRVPVEPGVLPPNRDGSARQASRLEPDPAIAPLVQLAFRMAAAGRTKREIHEATHLHTTNWSYRHTLANKIYKGVYVLGGEEIEGFCEPIVDDKLWEAAQGNKVPNGTGHTIYLLTRLATCGECGMSLLGNLAKANHKRYSYRRYRCPGRHHVYPARCNAKSFSADIAEQAVIGDVVDWLRDPVHLLELYEQHRELVAAGGDTLAMQIARQRLELVEVERSLHNIVEAIKLRGAKASPSLLEELEALEVQQLELETSLQTLGRQAQAKQPPAPVSPDQMAAWGERQAQKLLSADKREQKIILSGIISSLSLLGHGKDDIEINIEYRVPMPD